MTWAMTHRMRAADGVPALHCAADAHANGASTLQKGGLHCALAHKPLPTLRLLRKRRPPGDCATNKVSNHFLPLKESLQLSLGQ